MTDAQYLQCRFLGRLTDQPDEPPARLVDRWEGDYDELVSQAKRLVESTGQTIRAEDPCTGAPILVIEILPTQPNHYHIADWDHEGWVHRMERRMPMA